MMCYILLRKRQSSAANDVLLIQGDDVLLVGVLQLQQLGAEPLLGQLLLQLQHRELGVVLGLGLRPLQLLAPVVRVLSENTDPPSSV
eukprot:UN04598